MLLHYGDVERRYQRLLARIRLAVIIDINWIRSSRDAVVEFEPAVIVAVHPQTGNRGFDR